MTRRLLPLAAAAALAAASVWFAVELAASYVHLFSIFGATP